MTSKRTIKVLSLCVLLVILSAAVLSWNPSHRQVYSADGIHITASEMFGDVTITRSPQEGHLQLITWGIYDCYGSLDVVSVKELSNAGVEIIFADGSRIICEGSGKYIMGTHRPSN